MSRSYNRGRGTKRTSRSLLAWSSLLLALGVLQPLPAQATEKPTPQQPPQQEKAEKSKKQKEREKKKERVHRLEVPIPINHNAGGIKVPDYDREGQLQMVFEIGSAFRVNEDHLEMSNLKIETYDGEGKLETEISMETASLNLVSREIVSEKPVVIRRTGFEITGSNLVFQAKERNGTFQGPVKVLIFNRDDLDENPNQEGSENADTAP